MNYKIVNRFSKDNKRYIVYKFFKEGYEIKITDESHNLKFDKLKDVNTFLRKEGLKWN